MANGSFFTFKGAGKVSLSEYGGLIAVRGLYFSNSQVAKMQRMRTFHKPDWFAKNRLARERQGEN